MDFSDIILLLLIIGIGFGIYTYVTNPTWFQRLKDKYQTK